MELMKLNIEFNYNNKLMTLSFKSFLNIVFENLNNKVYSCNDINYINRLLKIIQELIEKASKYTNNNCMVIDLKDDEKDLLLLLI